MSKLGVYCYSIPSGKGPVVQPWWNEGSKTICMGLSPCLYHTVAVRASTEGYGPRPKASNLKISLVAESLFRACPGAVMILF